MNNHRNLGIMSQRPPAFVGLFPMPWNPRLGGLLGNDSIQVGPIGRAAISAAIISDLPIESVVEVPSLTPEDLRRQGAEFWEAKTLERLGVEQNVKAVNRLEEVLGAGATLWENELEFEAFLDAIYRRRREQEEQE